MPPIEKIERDKMSNSELLTLKKALSESRFAEFIKQEEKRGAGPINAADLEAALVEILKPQQSKKSVQS